eukprot:scaffold43558_cov69-Phaeocystis_antarctica.AAC.6
MQRASRSSTASSNVNASGALPSGHVEAIRVLELSCIHTRPVSADDGSVPHNERKPAICHGPANLNANCAHPLESCNAPCWPASLLQSVYARPVPDWPRP